MQIKAVIFDMDGVLTNSEPLIRAAAMAMFREMGLVVRPEDFIPFVGTGENRYIGGVAERYGWPLDITSAKRRTYEIYLELVPSQLEPFPGACEVVRMCRAAGLKTAVASSTDLVKLEANLRKIGLPPESWNAIVSGDAIARTKPAPDIFLTAAGRLGLGAQECVVVEDTVHGIEAAHAAGMRCVAVGQTFPADLLSGADMVRPAMTDVTLADLTGADVSFSLSEIIEKRRAEQYDLHRKYLNPAMARVQEIIGFNRNYSRGEGAYLWDADGCRYLDLLSGYSVFNLGRSHPVLKQALQEALALDRPNLVKMDCPLLAGVLAEELVKRMPPGLDAVFFANCGSEAVDTALKFARAATRRSRFLYLDHAFHGLTLGTLPANGGRMFREGFEPLAPGFDQVALNDLDALEGELRREDVAAFIVEPIQGKGVYIPADGYLPGAQQLCRRYGTLLICDEVQVGMGRTGRFLASEHWDLEPDMVTLSKSLSGGYVPVSAVVTRRRVYDKTFSRLNRCQVHSTTFGENELAMAAGLATLHVLDRERLIERAANMGERLLAGLTALRDRYDMVAEVRGKGLILGIEFQPPHSLPLKAAWFAAEAAQKGLFAQLVVMALMREHRILTQVGGPEVNIIKLLPPLVIGDEEVEMIVKAFDAVLREAQNLRGRVWGLSGELIKQALAG